MQSIKSFQKRAQSIFTFGFPNLYANINHNKLKFVLWESIKFSSKISLGNCITVTKFGTKWVDYKKISKYGVFLVRIFPYVD